MNRNIFDKARWPHEKRPQKSPKKPADEPLNDINMETEESLKIHSPKVNPPINEPEPIEAGLIPTPIPQPQIANADLADKIKAQMDLHLATLSPKIELKAPKGYILFPEPPPDSGDYEIGETDATKENG